MSLVGQQKKTRSPLLRAVFELDGEDVRLVEVKRVNGLLSIHRYQSWRDTFDFDAGVRRIEPWDSAMCSPNDPDEEWFQRDWESVGEDLMGDDLDGVRRLVVEGRMFCDYYNNPIDGAGYDSGFDVENVIERTER